MAVFNRFFFFLSWLCYNCQIQQDSARQEPWYSAWILHFANWDPRLMVKFLVLLMQRFSDSIPLANPFRCLWLLYWWFVHHPVYTSIFVMALLFESRFAIHLKGKRQRNIINRLKTTSTSLLRRRLPFMPPTSCFLSCIYLLGRSILRLSIQWSPRWLAEDSNVTWVWRELLCGWRSGCFNRAIDRKSVV